jgi:hypothetical protein
LRDESGCAALKPLQIKCFMPYKAKTVIRICGDLVMVKGVLLDQAREA